MATSTYEQLRAELARIAPWVIPVISVASANGATTYLIDTTLFQSTNSYYMTEGAARGMWIFLPDSSDATDRERQIGSVTVASGRLVIDGTAWSAAGPQAAAQYELSSIQPKVLFNLLTQAMENFPIPEILPLHDGNDEDMEASGTSSYSVSGAGSVSKVTAAGNVDTGSQSLFFNAGTASEYVEGATYRRMFPNRQYRTSITFRVDAGGPAYFAIWDKTNNVEIDASNRVSHSLESFMTLERRFVVPTGCEEVALRVYVTNNTDDVYIDNIHRPRKSTDTVLQLPSVVTRDSEVRKLLTARYGDTYGNGVYDSGSRTWEQWAVKGRHFATRFNSHYANPGRIELRPGVTLPDGEIWVEANVKASLRTTFAFTAAGETAPTASVDRYFLTLAWLKLISQYALDISDDDAEARTSLKRCNDELDVFFADYSKDLDTPSQEPSHPLAGGKMGL